MPKGTKGISRTEKDKESMRKGWMKRFMKGEKSYGKENAIKGREKIRKSKLGSKNPLWKGDNVGYSGLHLWIQSKLGKPNICTYCKKVKLSNRQIDWANKSHNYKRDLDDWIRLCRKCHIAYDRGLIKI